MAAHIKNVSVITIEIDLDPVPGWGNNPEDHKMMLERYLNETVPHYNPKITSVHRSKRLKEDIS